MNWKSLFTSGANMSPDEVRSFMAEHEPEEYQLLDVRQPKEYKKEHLPGATLIPVKELLERLSELDRKKPTFVYCRSGVRSKAAAQLLLANDFSHIFNMSGGIIAYEGGKAMGDESFGMEFFVRGNFSDVFRMSYAMEEGLQQLYLMLEDLCDNEEIKSLLARLAKFEEGHKSKLQAMFPDIADGKEANADILEGGFDKQQILGHFQSRIVTQDEIIQLGMMLETQAFDLYSRLVKKAKDAETREFFEFMVGEEKQHLELLTNEYDRILP
jgi:sulfur-carrier protein adenylyltransferase/sulfurtransferase